MPFKHSFTVPEPSVYCVLYWIWSDVKKRKNRSEAIIINIIALTEFSVKADEPMYRAKDDGDEWVKENNTRRN